MEVRETAEGSARPEQFDLEAQLERALEENPRLRDWFETARDASEVIEKANQKQSPTRPAPAIYGSAAV